MPASAAWSFPRGCRKRWAIEVDITLIDRADAFVFGFSKLDLMFGKRDPEAVRMHYGDLTTPHVRFRQESITSIDPARRRVETDLDAYEADHMVVALGADYDVAATPGLAEAGNEFYSVTGAETLRDVLPSFRAGNAIVGVCGAPFKCPPAPSEAAFLLDGFLRERGVRDDVTIHVVIPFGTPIPPSPSTSEAILSGFAERGIAFVPDRRVVSLDPGSHEAVLDDGSAPAVRPVPGHPGASGSRGRRGVRPRPRTGGSPSIRGRSPHASRASTRWVT